MVSRPAKYIRPDEISQVTVKRPDVAVVYSHPGAVTETTSGYWPMRYDGFIYDVVATLTAGTGTSFSVNINDVPWAVVVVSANPTRVLLEGIEADQDDMINITITDAGTGTDLVVEIRTAA